MERSSIPILPGKKKKLDTKFLFSYSSSFSSSSSSSRLYGNICRHYLSFLSTTNPNMMIPTLYYDFFDPHVPPHQVYIRVEENSHLQTQFQDLMNQWPVKKVITVRDVRYGQIIMSKDQVEEYILPQLPAHEQNWVNRRDYLPITVRDLDTLSEYRLCLWKNGSSSYVLTNGWSSSFVRRRGLQVGEEIGFYWDQRFGELRFSVLSRPPVHRQQGFGLL